ncbi:hypothetical protein GG344DRAFT_71481 [Lentinula edodes]|nr:hypothetical protein GG344DRAFT_71481 [Lentinula edodes]KAJ3911161.1 hypothetical protein F5877DRAFT_73404 [Lentinula edodes]
MSNSPTRGNTQSNRRGAATAQDHSGVIDQTSSFPYNIAASVVLVILYFLDRHDFVKFHSILQFLDLRPSLSRSLPPKIPSVIENAIGTLNNKTFFLAAEDATLFAGKALDPNLTLGNPVVHFRTVSRWIAGKASQVPKT